MEDGDKWCTRDPDPDEWTFIEEHAGPSYTRTITVNYDKMIDGARCTQGACCAYDRASASWHFYYTHSCEVTIYWGYNCVNMGIMTLCHEYQHTSIRDERTSLWGAPNAWFYTNCTETSTPPDPLGYGCPEGFAPM